MVERQPSWDRYEAAILLEGLLTSMKGELTRSDAIKAVSRDLRVMALHRGMEVDEVYRNTNGISFQMKSMESAYLGRTVFKPATKLFADVAGLYHESYDEYQKLLKEARAMISNRKTVEDDFMRYLAERVSPTQLSEFYRCYSEIETFCLKIKVLQNPLFETTDFETIKKVQRTIEQNKIFRITRRRQINKIVDAGQHYYNYIKEGLYARITDGKTVEDRSTIDYEMSNQSPPDVEMAEVESPITAYTKTKQDERLLQKHPAVYNQIYNALKASPESQRVTIREICEAINHTARPAIVEEILDNVSWASNIGDSYIFSENTPAIESDISNTESSHSQDTTFEIDFHADFDLAYTKPERFSYFGERKACGDSWTALYVAVMASVMEDYPHIFKPGMSFAQKSGRIELASDDNYSFMIAPKPIPGTAYMLETNLSANDIAAKIRYVLDLCSVDYENIVITYRKKEKETFEQVHQRKSFENDAICEINSRSFSRYLSEKLNMADATCRSYASAINNCEAFAQEHQLASWQLYATDKQTAQETIQLLLSNAEFLSYNARQHNRFRAAIQKFLGFIGSDLTWTAPVKDDSEPAETYRDEGYEEVLRQYFKKGFRMDSPLEIRKFKRYYTATHDRELTDPDDDISKKIKQLCIIYEGKAFLPDVMLSEELKDELLNYIESAFADGKAAIYYQAIFAEFSDAFLDYHIHDADMLKSYLTFIGDGRFFINRSFISKTPDVSMDPLSEVRSCLQDYGRPATYDEIFAALPHLPQSKIKFILASNVEFVNNGRSEYFHESIVHLSDEELDGISGIIQRTIDEKDFIGGNELYDVIRAKYPYIIDENQALSMYGFRDALKAKLGDKFSFKGNIISRSGQELSMADVFAKYARSHDTFTLSELQSLANNLATPIYFEAIYENSLRISRDQFVAKTAAHFPVEAMDETLDRICMGKYIPLLEATNFSAFPYVGFPWNIFLLEHYVASYSQKYMLLHSSFNGTECAGAIVKRSAGINSFDDLIVDLLANNQIEMKKAPVLQFLSDKGYLARRRYSEIESLIIKANAQRQRKDTD